MQDKTKENPTNFNAAGKLGKMFEKAKSHNRFNSAFQSQLPSELSGLSLSLVDDQKVFLVAKNPSVAYRAQRQKKLLLTIIKKIEGLSGAKSLVIRVDEKKY
ncbi:MAG: hypothetical protein HN449_04790 [Thiotrichales bacterium]|jgi:hypothetical protein|nr:hypothetical protein [Thiotrichales bacterium]MBT4652880.1 hypothetical protein [Thiotrichales bacterium]MDC3315207.1 hypothetical protein [Candidatus Thioglobus sp.]|tara:strand:- start:4397 stop:4702 length:306 start_codon:yes stop_codon:yes gene_type:complete